MKKILFIATSVLMAACSSTPKTPAINTENFDTSVSPKENFYQYVTGGWQKSHPLRADQTRFGSFDVLHENNEIRINELFKEMGQKTFEMGSIEQKISDLYKQGLDSARMNKDGAEPIRRAIEMIQSLDDRSHLTHIIAHMHKGIENPFFDMSVGPDLKNSSMNTLFASQNGLMLGNRDYYLDKENENIIKAYKEYLHKIFQLSGIAEEKIEKMVENVVKVETEIATTQWSNVELRNMPALYNPMSKADFEKTYNSINWEEYYRIMGIGDYQEIIVTTPSALAGVNKLLAKEDISALRDYLLAQYINSAKSALSDDFKNAGFDFFGRVMSGAQEMKPLWKRAMDVPNSILSQAVGKMYVEKYFPEKDKVRMLELVKNLQSSLSQHIANLKWMSDETKARAQEKLSAFIIKIGYPDTWKDYSTLSIDPEKTYWENLKEAGRWYTAENIAKLGKPVDKAEWQMPPQMVNAYYNPTTNEICFPAAILQPPFYNPDADDAVNYGGIGVVIGHEMTHGFDDQGRNFDKDGNMNNWWTDEDSKAFQEKAEILVKQFDACEVLPAKDGKPAMMANGKQCLGENIADQGGLNVAYTAFHNTLKEGDKDPMIDGLSYDQRFYISYATLWASTIRDAEVARLTKLDVHSMAWLRTNTSLKNLQPFYDAFDIKEGDAMYRPEEERVIIW